MTRADYNGVVNIANFALETKSDLNKVKQELNKVSQELEVYKKALELACATIAYSAPRMDEPYYYVKQYLQRAREE